MKTELEEIKWCDTPFPLEPSLMLVARRGSESHGTYVPKEDPNSIDDRDIFGLVQPPREWVTGMKNWEHAESIKGVWDVVLDDFRKFVGMLSKSNPNVIGMLWLREEDYLLVTPAARVLIENRGLFVSKRFAFDAFVGYARAQLKKMEKGAFNGFMGAKRKGLVEKYGYDCKNAAHCVRLLHMGGEYLLTGQVNVFRTWDREMLIEIKTGKWPLERVKAYAEQAFAGMQSAYDESKLPELPQYEKIAQLADDVVWGWLHGEGRQ